MIIISPCKGCSNRVRLCHSSCLGYKDYRNKIEEADQARTEFLKGNTYFYEKEASRSRNRAGYSEWSYKRKLVRGA